MQLTINIKKNICAHASVNVCTSLRGWTCIDLLNLGRMRPTLGKQA